MKNYYKIYLILTTLFMVFGCDEATQPFRQSNTVQLGTRKVLLEEFTGYNCTNCPEATDLAKSLAEMYNGHVILISVHTGSYAVPLKKAGFYDFRTTFGDTLSGNYKVDAFPSGLVNRLAYNGSTVLSSGAWGSAIIKYISDTARVQIKINPSYDTATKMIDVKINVNYLGAVKSSNYLTVYIIEDSIVQYQLDKRRTPPEVFDYVHNHVLRTSMNGTWGELLGAGPFITGTNITKEYKTALPQAKTWVSRPEKLKIVAFVYDGNTKEVLNVEESDLIK